MFIPVDEAQKLAESIERGLDGLDVPHTTVNIVGYLDLYGMLYHGSRTAKWIRKPRVYGVVYCSNCGYELRIPNSNYCPNCGFKMSLETVEE